MSLHLFGLGKEKLSGVLETKDKIPLTHLDKGGQNAHPKSVLCEKNSKKIYPFTCSHRGRRNGHPFFKKIFTPSLV